MFGTICFKKLCVSFTSQPVCETLQEQISAASLQIFHTDVPIRCPEGQRVRRCASEATNVLKDFSARMRTNESSGVTLLSACRFLMGGTGPGDNEMRLRAVSGWCVDLTFIRLELLHSWQQIFAIKFTLKWDFNFIFPHSDIKSMTYGSRSARIANMLSICKIIQVSFNSLADFGSIPGLFNKVIIWKTHWCLR